LQDTNILNLLAKKQQYFFTFSKYYDYKSYQTLIVCQWSILSFAQLKVQKLQHANSNIFFHNLVSMILIVYHTLFQNALKTYHLKIEIYPHKKEEKQKSI
jgi:phosphatidylserine synthase